MQVFQFQKTFLERLDECLSVLSWKDQNISASQVKAEWAYFIELQIEPSGWQALWKIPRNICEKLKVSYPSIVFGYIERVNFQDLNAIYIITGVHDESVHLPERHEVTLEDLWPTVIQENTALNIERTADCLDRLRFFYENIWMPWDKDNDDDFNWVEKHLHSRLKLCFDLQQHNISRPISSYIHSIIAEAKFIEQKREIIEEDIADEESDKCDKEILEKPRLKQLMIMHMRMTVIRSHIEILENPDMQSIFQDVKFHTSQIATLCTDREEENAAPSYRIVILPSSIATQIELLKIAEKIIPKDASIFVNNSLQDVLDTSKSGDNIFLSTGCHMVQFVEYFFNSGQISGIKCESGPNQDGVENSVRIFSPVSNSSFFVFDGNFTLENLELDCRNIVSGIIVKRGMLKMKNCKLVGNGISSVQQGVVCNAYGSVYLESCIIDNFASGVILSEKASLTLKDTFISNCNVGVEMTEQSTITCSKSSFKNGTYCAIYLRGLLLEDIDIDTVELNNLKDLNKYSSENIYVSSDCDFEKCNNIICIVNDKRSIVSRKTLTYIENAY